MATTSTTTALLLLITAICTGQVVLGEIVAKATCTLASPNSTQSILLRAEKIGVTLPHPSPAQHGRPNSTPLEFTDGRVWSINCSSPNLIQAYFNFSTTSPGGGNGSVTLSWKMNYDFRTGWWSALNAVYLLGVSEGEEDMVDFGGYLWGSVKKGYRCSHLKMNTSSGVNMDVENLKIVFNNNGTAIDLPEEGEWHGVGVRDSSF